MAGLPGTGLGGIFYVLLVLWMSTREAWRAAGGNSARPRWIRIATLASLAAGIVLVLWVEGWALRHLLGAFPALGGHNGRSAPIGTGAFAIEAVAPALAVLPFALLAALLLGIHAARLWLPGTRRAPVEPSLPRGYASTTEPVRLRA